MQEERYIPFRVSALLMLMLTFLCANAQETPPNTVVPLGVSAITQAQASGPNLACGFHGTYSSPGVPSKGSAPLAVQLQLIDLSVNPAVATVVTDDHADWNLNRDTLSSVVCPGGQVWFTTSERTTGKKSLWKIGADGVPVSVLRPGDFFGGAKYLDGATLIGNANRGALLGQFASPFGDYTMAFTLSAQLLGNYGNGVVLQACLTNEFLVTATQFTFGPWKYAYVMRGNQAIANIPDIGNPGSQNTALRNLTYSIGCNSNTAVFMIRAANTNAWAIKDTEVTPGLIFSDATAGATRITNFWGMTVDVNGVPAFAMDDIAGSSVFKIVNGSAVAKAVECIDFNVGCYAGYSGVTPLAVDKRLLFFVAPLGGGYEIK